MVKRRRSRVTIMRVWARENVLTLVLCVFILLSMLVNAYTFAVVYQTRRLLRAQLETAVTNLAAARKQTIHYEFPIQQSFPFSTTVQLNESLDVPIHTTVPIRQKISVPVDVPVVGTVDLPVDLNFDVPVSTTVTVAIKKQIPISTSVDLNTNVPINLDLGQAPLGDVLRSLEDRLRAILAQF
jgi:hypothetical protein